MRAALLLAGLLTATPLAAQLENLVLDWRPVPALSLFAGKLDAGWQFIRYGREGGSLGNANGPLAVLRYRAEF